MMRLLLAALPLVLLAPAAAEAQQCLRCPPRRPLCRTITCVEAYFQLRHCGFQAHDRDRDGVPCEAVCGRNRPVPPRIPPPCPPL